MPDSRLDTELWLIRHGETEWSISGAHTGRTDISLTSRGEERAVAIRKFLAGKQFSLVLSSPKQRALQTCRISGYEDVAAIEEDLSEWDYGAYEGRTTRDIRRDYPDWFLWSHGVPGGEPIDQVAERAKRVIQRCLAAGGPSVLFAHGHILRILAACWLGLKPEDGRLFALGTGSVSILGFEHHVRVISLWNRSFDSDPANERQ